MKKIIVFGVALVAILGLSGCNNDTKTVVIGEPLEVIEQLEGVCDVPMVITAKTFDQDANITVDENTSYNSEWGMDVSFTVVTPCIEVEPCQECNITDPEVVPIEPEPTCEDGFVLVEQGCMPIRYIPTKVGEEYNDCIDGYRWKSKREVCRIIIEE